MSLPSTIKNEYLNGEFDSFAWMKELRRRDVEDLVYSLRPRPRFKANLMLHQLVCFYIAVAYPQFFFMLDMGTGKTLVMLEVFRYLQLCQLVNRGLVFCPTEEVAYGWEEQITDDFKMTDIDFTLLLGSSGEKWDRLAEFGDGLVIATYAGLVTMCSDQVKKPGKKTDRRKFVWKPSLKKLKTLADPLQMVVWDESTEAGNQQSTTFRIANQVSKRAEYRYNLAGRPFGRDVTPLWSQFFLVDRGETLGKTLGFFREVFFSAKQNYWGGPRSFKYTFKKSMRADLNRIIGHRSINYDAVDCIDLPPVTQIVRRVSLPDETDIYYERVLGELKKARGNVQATQHAFMRLRQISSGFLGYKDDDTGERAQFEFADNPKLDLMMSLIDEVPDGRKAIIFHEFTYSGRKISEALKARGLKHGWVWSGTKDYPAIKRKFNNDPDFRWLIVNVKKGSLGLNLQAANYTFYYESPVSPVDRDQGDRRARRQGQKFRCFIYDLIVKDTADEAIIGFHQEGRDLFQAVVRNVNLLSRNRGQRK